MTKNTQAANPKSVLVTGGSGFLGTALVRQLVADGFAVMYTYRSQPIEGLEKYGRRLDLAMIADYGEYEQDFASVDCLVHAAATVTHGAQRSVEDFEEHIVRNYLAFENLVRHLPNLRKIVYISSCSAQLAEVDPSFYGFGKLFMEKMVPHLVEPKHVQVISLRFPQLYGPGEPHGTFVTKFIQRLSNNEPIQLVNNGKVVRDVLYIKDAVGSIAHALTANKSGIFTVTDPKTHTVREVLDAILKATGASGQKIEDRTVPGQAAGVSLHATSTAEKLGYKLGYNLDTGIRETVKMWSSHVSS